MKTIEPVVRSITVERSVADAFRIFTDELGSWWPLGTHSIGDDKVATAVLEGRAGGRIFERWHDGTEHEWGTILVWEPPHRIVVSWKPNPARSAATEWEATFDADGEATRVRIEHRGWERLGDIAVEARDSYTSGWPGVLHAFAQATAA